MKLSTKQIDLFEQEYEEDHAICPKCKCEMTIYHSGEAECPVCDYDQWYLSMFGEEWS